MAKAERPAQHAQVEPCRHPLVQPVFTLPTQRTASYVNIAEMSQANGVIDGRTHRLHLGSGRRTVSLCVQSRQRSTGGRMAPAKGGLYNLRKPHPLRASAFLPTRNQCVMPKVVFIKGKDKTEVEVPEGAVLRDAAIK